MVAGVHLGEGRLGLRQREDVADDGFEPALGDHRPDMGDDPLSQLLSLVAVAFAAMNVTGAYLVTDRMLEMFKKRPATPKPADAGASGEAQG